MLILSLVVLAAAQQPDCNDPQDQTSMNICADRGYRAADAELNRVWPQTLRRVQELDRGTGNGRAGEAERRLRAAQRAWIAWRDAQCELAGIEALGGSLEPLLVSGCLRDLTDRRIAELRMLLEER